MSDRLNAAKKHLEFVRLNETEGTEECIAYLIRRVESQQQVIDGYARDWHSLSCAAGEKQQEIDRLRAENEKLRELLSLVWDYCRVDDNAVTEADLERKAYECREVLGE